MADMAVSSGGSLRLSKTLMEKTGVKPGDRLIIMQDTENPKITLQIQRGNKVILRLNNAELINVENNNELHK